jgi:DNA polymerase
MGWTERQQTLLRAMGLRVWVPAASMPLPHAERAERAERATSDATLAPAVAKSAASVQQVLAATPLVQRTAERAPVPAAPYAAPAARQVARVAEPPRQESASRPVSAGLDWPALREAVAGCRACGLCQSRTQTVFGTGHPQAHWMVVGEAPGEQEDASGLPFVGPAGQLLDRMLAALQLSRAEDGELPPQQRVFIANTLKCRPPHNRNPAPEEMAQCEHFLQRQIELVQPRMILAMGRFAVQALLRSNEPVGRLRGRVHRYHGVPLVVTYHPAYLLRNLPDKARAWEDLCLAAGVAEQAGA